MRDDLGNSIRMAPVGEVVSFEAAGKCLRVLTADPRLKVWL